VDLRVLPSHQHFAILHGSPGRPVANWQTRYALGRELGSGQTATVFEAFALAPRVDDMDARLLSPRTGGKLGGQSPSQSSGRRVALKRFHQKGTVMFKNELKALLVAGVHPHVVRLLESFQGFDDDVLVLEYCDGGDIYELYASSNGCSMLEGYVSQMVRQVVLAIQHLVDRGIEHRDVKPENLLLYGAAASSRTQEVPLVKLADFGWAAIVDRPCPPPPVPAEGVGSLWYAPPELNPPVKGAEIVIDDLQGGRSDMWSIGVVTYLLLTGHSPFNLALTISDPVEREEEVMRLAAFGQLNTSTKAWSSDLSHLAREFILACAQADPAKRFSPADALNHGFLSSSSTATQFVGFRLCSSPSMDDLSARWDSLDTFQRLCWLAVARAVTEPELLELNRVKDFIRKDGGACAGYIDRLAAQLVAVASPSWFTSQAWADVLYLAFLYLDIDCDGFLSADDLTGHIPGSRAREVSQAIYKWKCHPQALSLGTANFLTYYEFNQALSSATCAAWPVAPAARQRNDVTDDVAMEYRMDAIEEACRKIAGDDLDSTGMYSHETTNEGL